MTVISSAGLGQIQANYQRVLERIHTAAKRSGRDPDLVQLVVVTKTYPVVAIREVLAAGGRNLGENYAEEAEAKILELADEADIHWHMIGHVQSRKARLVSQYFSCLHSLDSAKLARRLGAFCGEFGRRLPVFIEINVSGEASKSGLPAWEEENWTQLLPVIQEMVETPNLSIIGLMTMPPFSSEPEHSRPYYEKLIRLRDFLAAEFTHLDWAELSMGMSSDFEIAVENGATWVRIGQAILGPRES